MITFEVEIKYLGRLSSLWFDARDYFVSFRQFRPIDWPMIAPLRLELREFDFNFFIGHRRRRDVLENGAENSQVRFRTAVFGF